MLVRRVELGGGSAYFAGIRAQVAECLKGSKAAYAPLTGQVSVDFGIVNCAADLLRAKAQRPARKI